MNIEHMTKQQIVILCIFIAVVTSMVTSIVTTSLNGQNTNTIHTVNRIIEKTVESIPGKGDKADTIRETIIVKADDQVVETIEKIRPNILKIFFTEDVGEEKLLAGMGFVLPLGDLSFVVSNYKNLAPGATHTALNASGTSYLLEPVTLDQDRKVSVFYIKNNTGEPTKNLNFNEAALGKVLDIKLGQTVISFGGKGSTNVNIGTIAEIEDTNGRIVNFKVTLNNKDLVMGSPIVSLSGKVLGIFSGEYSSDSAVFVASTILEEIIPKRDLQ